MNTILPAGTHGWRHLYWWKIPSYFAPSFTWFKSEQVTGAFVVVLGWWAIAFKRKR